MGEVAPERGQEATWRQETHTHIRHTHHGASCSSLMSLTAVYISTVTASLQIKEAAELLSAGLIWD